MKFKTNIKCGACVEKVTPGLNELAGEGNWSVDLTDPKRILTIKGDAPSNLNNKLKEVGYFAEEI